MKKSSTPRLLEVLRRIALTGMTMEKKAYSIRGFQSVVCKSKSGFDLNPI